MKVFIVSTMILACAFAAPGVIDNRVESDSSSNKMMQYFSSCFDNDDITSCLAVKGIAALNRAARASNIQIAKGVVLTRYISGLHKMYIVTFVKFFFRLKMWNGKKIISNYIK